MPDGFLRVVAIFFVVIGLLLGALRLTQADRNIRTQIEIGAPPETVWRVLTGTGSYAYWNPYIVSLKGMLAPGEKLEVTVRPPGAMEMSFVARVVAATPNRELAWRGGIVVPGLFEGEHSFRLEPTPGGGTRVLHTELFRGLLVGRISRSILDGTEAGFSEFNLALKIQSEKVQSEGRR